MDSDHLLEEDIPWEVRLIKEYCKSTADLDCVSSLKKLILVSVLGV